MKKSSVQMFVGGLRPNARKAYQTTLRQFFFAIKKPVERATPQDAMRFVDHLRSRRGEDGLPLSDTTIRQRFSILRAVCNFLHDIGEIKSNPFNAARRQIRWRQEAQKRPTALIPFDKVLEVLELPDPTKAKGRSHRALLSILFGSGLRRSEATGLNVGDVMLSQEGIPYLLIRSSKAGKTQRQPLPPWAYEAVSVLLTDRKSAGAVDTDPLFVTTYRGGNRVSAKTAYNVYRGYFRKLGIKAAPHSARATAATKLYEDGWTVEEIAEFLRHASTDQVSVYVKVVRGLNENAGRTLEY